jgi:hypothetical protein
MLKPPRYTQHTTEPNLVYRFILHYFLQYDLLIHTYRNSKAVRSGDMLRPILDELSPRKNRDVTIKFCIKSAPSLAFCDQDQ